MVKDLTKGNVRPVLWSFTIPMFISVVFQQLYNIADSAIAGRFAGEDALAAVGASYPITMIFMAIAIGCNVGCAVVISSYFGAGDIRHIYDIDCKYCACSGFDNIWIVDIFLFDADDEYTA